MEDQKRALSLLWDLGSVALAYGVLWLAAVFGAGLHGPAAPFWALKVFKADWPQWWIITLFSAAIGAALAIGFNPFRTGGEYGSARFARLGDLKKWGLLSKTGLILGVFHGRYIRFKESLSVLVVAPPGSGKSAAVIVPNLLSCGNSMVVVDVKEELYRLTAKHRKTFSKVYKFAPGEDDSAAWNPFSRKELPAGWDDVILLVGQIGAVLFAPATEKADPYWLNQGKSVFLAFALYLIHKNGETSIPGVRTFGLSQNDPQLLLAQIADEPGVPLRVLEEARKFITMADKQWSGVWGAFNDRLDVFADPRVAKNFTGCDFRITDLRTVRTTIYLKATPADIDRLAPCLAMFCEAAALRLISKDRAPGEFVVTFLPDEFPRLPKMEALVNLPAVSRGAGVNSVFVVQAKSQVVDKYGEQATLTLMNTCAYQLYFAQNESNLAESVSRAIGNRTRKKFSFSTSESRITRNTSEVNEGVPLVSSQDVMGMKLGELLILKQNSFPTPILAKSAYWAKDGAMKGLVTP